jgi:hypothetical protein
MLNEELGGAMEFGTDSFAGFYNYKYFALRRSRMGSSELRVRCCCCTAHSLLSSGRKKSDGKEEIRAERQLRPTAFCTASEFSLAATGRYKVQPGR